MLRPDEILFLNTLSSSSSWIASKNNACNSITLGTTTDENVEQQKQKRSRFGF